MTQLAVIFDKTNFPEIMRPGGTKRVKQIALRKAAEHYQKKIKEKYETEGLKVTGALISSVKVQGSQRDNDVILQSQARHAAPIEFGSKNYPRQPPIADLIPWVQKRFGVSGQRAVRLAFMMARRIKAGGTAPHPVWGPVFESESNANDAALIIAREFDLAAKRK